MSRLFIRVVFVVAATGCGPVQQEGVSTSAVIDANGQVESITLAAIHSNLGGGAETFAKLAVTPAAAGKSFVEHVGFEYPPNGHPPAGFTDVPHLDMHFLAISPQEQKKIDCSDRTAVPPERLPPDFPPPELASIPGGGCVSGEGTYTFDALVADGPLTTTMAMGYHAGLLISINPIIAMSVLDEKKPFGFEIRAPQALGRSTRYPTRFDGTYEEATDTWSFTVSKFVALD